MLHTIRLLLLLAITSLIAVAIAACGGDDDDSGSTEPAAATSAATTGSTISVQSIGDAGEVLVDAQGRAVYTNDRDKGSMIACTGECTTIWLPVAASGGAPTSEDPSVEGLGTVDRPDGTSQLTFDGRPLYTFAEEGAGEVTGDGFADSFGGTEFIWTVASPGGASTGSTGGTDTETDTSSGGGYGY